MPRQITTPSRVHRRTVLASLAGGLAAACTAESPAHPAHQATHRHQPDPQLADLSDEQNLLDSYDATIAAHPDLAARLRPLRAHHAQHVAALHGAIGAATGGAVPSPAASAPVTLPTAGARVPATSAAALAALRDAEHTASAARTRSCLTAQTDRAALLGSIAACEASHAELLR